MINSIEWRKINGFDDYEVSNTGLVRSYRPSGKSRRKPSEPTIMSQTLNKRYFKVPLRRGYPPKVYSKLIHRIMAIAFIPNPNNLSDVAHNNGICTDNRIENLRWASHQENQMDMRHHGTMQDGIKSNTCKITPDIAKYIRDTCASKKRGIQLEMCTQFGLSKAQICRIVNGKRWKYLIENH